MSECSTESEHEYDLGLHIGAVFIIMGCSFLGTCLPIVGRRVSFLQGVELPWNCAKMFGSGVILATGLVHMLTPATDAFSNPCLPPSIQEDYSAYPTAICLFAILLLHFIQLMAMKYVVKSENVRTQNGTEMKANFISTVLLELGVASHSIVIGLTLGVTSGSEFIPLLIALVFHQFFEGVALSAVVLETQPDKKFASIILVTFYSLATPFGIAVGIGAYQSVDTNSQGALISTGVLDAFSAGVLLYDGLVNIVNNHFKSAKYMLDSNVSQFSQLASLWFGAFIMSLVGKWA